MAHTKPAPDEEAETESEAEAPEWALGNEEEDDLVVKVPALKGENIKKEIWRYSLTCAWQRDPWGKYVYTSGH